MAIEANVPEMLARLSALKSEITEMESQLLDFNRSKAFLERVGAPITDEQKTMILDATAGRLQKIDQELTDLTTAVTETKPIVKPVLGDVVDAEPIDAVQPRE